MPQAAFALVLQAFALAASFFNAPVRNWLRRYQSKERNNLAALGSLFVLPLHGKRDFKASVAGPANG